MPSLATRASRAISNASLWDLVEDMAKEVEKQAAQLEEVLLLCTRILERLDSSVSV